MVLASNYKKLEHLEVRPEIDLKAGTMFGKSFSKNIWQPGKNWKKKFQK